MVSNKKMLRNIIIASSVIFASGNIDRDLQLLQPRIVNGEDASLNEHPYFGLWHGCGSVLVWKDILLTAGHCQVVKESRNQVLVGAHYREQQTGDGSVVRNITKRVVHPDFSFVTYANDFMLLKLDRPVDTIRPIPLNTFKSLPADGADLTTMGFGSISARVDQGDDPSGNVAATTEEHITGKKFNSLARTNYLQTATIQVIGDETCNRRDWYNNQIDDDIMICAGKEDGGTDSCFGDSGGPLVMEYGPGNHVLMGIISFGIGCARAKRPGVYSRVSSGVEWIRSNICEMSSERPDYCPPVEPPTATPTDPPTLNPTLNPTISPTSSPTSTPTVSPTDSPHVTPVPTISPTEIPTISPTFNPTKIPSSEPTPLPTPSSTPSDFPSDISNSLPLSGAAAATTATPTLSPITNAPTKRPVGRSSLQDRATWPIDREDWWPFRRLSVKAEKRTSYAKLRGSVTSQ